MTPGEMSGLTDRGFLFKQRKLFDSGRFWFAPGSVAISVASYPKNLPEPLKFFELPADN